MSVAGKRPARPVAPPASPSPGGAPSMADSVESASGHEVCREGRRGGAGMDQSGALDAEGREREPGVPSDWDEAWLPDWVIEDVADDDQPVDDDEIVDAVEPVDETEAEE